MMRSIASVCLIVNCLIVSAVFPADSADRDAYGGWKKLQFEATGFFAVRERDGLWWLVTPEGNAFLSKGVNHVSFRADDAPSLGYSPYERAVRQKHGTENAWAKAVVDRLAGWGFNTLGSWCSSSTFDRDMPYTVNLDLATRAGADWLKGAVGDFFSKDFEERMEAACREQCGPRAKDPWLLGYFTDNELRWGADWRGNESLLDEYLRLPEGAAGRKAALEFLQQRHGDIASFNQAWGMKLTRWEELTGRESIDSDAAEKDQAAWQEVVARRYFATCRNAIRNADPNHLILGCRFAGQAPNPVLRGISGSVDVVSFNDYGQNAPAGALRNIHRLTGRPIMLTEFSFKAMDSGLPNTRGAGKPVATQADRAEGFTRYVHGLIDLPFMVGFHWFEHADEPKEGRFDGENSNYGLVSIEDHPWEVLVQAMTRVNAGLDERHLQVAKESSSAADGAERGIRRLINAVDPSRISKHVFYLAEDPLPFRKLNLTLPGHSKSTLDEADDYLASNLEAWGYRVEREPVQVQAFRRDTNKPKSAQYSAPKPEDPWYTAHNLYAEKKGRTRPERIILVLAHKDSQSWIDSPGANDNAVGTAGVLEMARVLATYSPESTIRFLLCNEEHIPWTSKTAAQNAKARGDDIIAVFNLDGIGAKPTEQTVGGRKTNVTAYTKPEGKRLADLMSEVNLRYSIGLEQRSAERTQPGDDDGSFIMAGYPAAVINIGSWPYGDPEYHCEGDVPANCDVENAAMTVQATLAAVATLDRGAPSQANWPQFRGPKAGVVEDEVLPETWSTTEHVAWTTEIPGYGWASPIVWGDRVFVTTAVAAGDVEMPKKGLYLGGDRDTPSDKTHQWKVYCIDFAGGRILWERTAHKGWPAYAVHIKNSRASETPVTDGERVYAYFGNVGLFCYDFDGNLLWSKKWDSVKTRANWGTAASPVLYKDRLYILNDNDEKSFLSALDARTGEQVWRVERDEKSNWATPYLWENDRRVELVTSGTRRVRSYDLSGKLLWELAGTTTIAIPTPFAADGLLYVTGGFVADRERPLYAIRPGADGDITLQEDRESNEFIAWCRTKAGPYNPSPIAYKGHVYVLYDRGLLSCFDARTGKEIYSNVRIAPGANAFTASPWANNGKLFCLSEDGDTFVVQAGPEYRLLGCNKLEEMCMATPAAVGGSLFIRTLSKLYCIRE